MKRKTLFTMVALLAVTMLGITALAADGNLPGGTSISVSITAPANGTLRAHPPGNITLQGTASVGQGLPIANTLIVYVLDVSGSTGPGSPFSGTGCGLDQNGNGSINDILDCEIAAAKALNDLAVSTGTVGDVGVAVFALSGASADVGPAAGDQLITGPATDADADSNRDVEQVLASTFSVAGGNGGVNLFTNKTVGVFTNFEAGLNAAIPIINASTMQNKIVVFMSDGVSSNGDPTAVVMPAGVVIKSFAIGTPVLGGTTLDCNTDMGNGSLQDVADRGATGSDCQEVETIADLPNVVPGVIASQLLSLSLSVNGGAPVDISGSASMTLPQNGPVSVTFSTPVNLTPGIHELCVTATGSDGGGMGDVTDCIDVTVADIVLEPPTDTNEFVVEPDHTVTAIVEAGADGGVNGVMVNFSVVSGPNIGASGSVPTAGGGMAMFTYPGPGGLGTDVIQACFTDDLGTDACATATKEWVDTTPPDAACVETTNPSGKNIPKASKQNEDGFYELLAVDLVDPDPQIYVEDTGSGHVFGPFTSTTKIKYTEAPGAPPSQKKMGSDNGQASAISWHLKGNGDAAVYAIDFSGNQSDPVACLVPPPPK